MAFLMQLLESYSVATVFLSVMLEQAGIPVPAYPTLILAGSGAEKAGASPLMLLLAAMIAALIADLAWYYAGRRHGKRMMTLLSRIPLFTAFQPSQASAVHLGWSTYALLVAKFIPGFSTAAGAMAGNLGMRLPVFVLFDLAGTGIWAGSALLLGVEFGSDISKLLEFMSSLGTGTLLLVAALACVCVFGKLRHRSQKQSRLEPSDAR